MVKSKRLSVISHSRGKRALERFYKECRYVSSDDSDKCAVSGFVGVIDKPVVRDASKQTTINGLLRFLV